jgi:hypothetical protein
VEDSREHGNEPSVSTKYSDFLDKVSNYYVLTKDSDI